MKILYDHTVFQFQRYGGISRYFYELITRLSIKEDVGISLFHGFHINEYTLSEHKQNFDSYWGYKWKYKKPAAMYLWLIFAIPNKILFNNFIRSSDVNIYHPTYYRNDLDNYNKSAIVLTVHDMIHELYPDQFIDSRFVIKTKKKSINTADQIICVSVDSKSILTAEYNINPEKIIVIPNGVNTNKFYPIKSIKQVENSLLYVGRIDERKGVDFLIKSMTLVKLQNPKVKLFIGGRGKKLFELRKYVKKYNLQNNIKFIGFIPDTKLNKCYNKVKCVVVPSIFEGFGLTVIEAMAAGAPVIGTDVDGIRTIIRNGKNGYLVEYGDTESLSNMILNVLQNDNSEVIRNELITVKSEYNWDEISKKVGEIYDEL